MALIKDRFDIEAVDSETQKYFDNIARLRLRGRSADLKICLDINSALVPQLATAGKSVEVFIQDRLEAGGTTYMAEEGIYHPNLGNDLLQAYPGLCYVMHGTVFEVQTPSAAEGGTSRLALYISFGGLMCEIVGPESLLSRFRYGQKVYLVCLNLS